MIADFGSFQIRRAVAKDILQIHALTQLAFESYIRLAGIGNVAALSETPEDIEKDINNPSMMVFVSYIEEKIVGSARVKLKGDSIAYFSRFGVDPDYQNLGIGKAILNVVDYSMRKLKVRQLQLHTASKITSLIRFYYGRGFYIDSTDKSKGYIRALLCKDYSE